MAIPKRKISGQREEHKYPDWLQLPEGVLDKILQKLPLSDRISFGNVCKLWRNFSIEALRYNPCRRLPWLVMSGQTQSTTRSCVSILENKLWNVEIPKAYGGYLWGSFDNWLIIVKSARKYFKRIRISLLNPFSGAEILLPIADKKYHKLALSGNPREQNCMYMLLNLLSSKFALWMKGVEGWYECELETKGGPYIDVISFNDCFYFLTKDYNFHVVEISSASSAIKQKNSMPVVIKSRFCKVEMYDVILRSRKLVLRYLLEFHGEILLVCRLLDIQLDTRNFKIYKLDFCRMFWVKLKSLGDDVLFVGRNCSRCFSAEELGDFEADCIYFTNEFEPGWRNEWKPDRQMVGSQIADWGIFRFGGSRFRLFSYRATNRRWPPIWMTAPLGWYFLLGNKPESE